jgi:hypothetical protein
LKRSDRTKGSFAHCHHLRRKAADDEFLGERVDGLGADAVEADAELEDGISNRELRETHERETSWTSWNVHLSGKAIRYNRDWLSRFIFAYSECFAVHPSMRFQD